MASVSSGGVKDANSYLAGKQKSDKELSSEWAVLEELYNKKYVILLGYISFTFHNLKNCELFPYICLLLRVELCLKA